MEDCQLLPPDCKRAKLSAVSIDELPDSLLAKIFCCLPFKDRHQLCLVSSKWADASRIPWSDITFLNLSCIPRAMLPAILALCPMIREIEAHDRSVNLDDTMADPPDGNANVDRVTLRNVIFVMPSTAVAGKVMPLLSAFFRHFSKPTELILQNVRVAYPAHNPELHPPKFTLPLIMPQTTAAALRRLVLINSTPDGYHGNVSVALKEMLNLECLFLTDSMHLDYCLSGLPLLRELCLVAADTTLCVLAAAVAHGKFPKLEVLLYASRQHVDPKSVSQLIVATTPLRILVISGCDSLLAYQHCVGLVKQAINPAMAAAYLKPSVIAAREHLALVGTNYESISLPFLHIFVGGHVTQYLHFTLPKKPDIAKFWRIDCPMPEFLAKPKVAEIFKDVWTAKIIREGPENGLKPWGHPDEMNLFYSTSPLQFC